MRLLKYFVLIIAIFFVGNNNAQSIFIKGFFEDDNEMLLRVVSFKKDSTNNHRQCLSTRLITSSPELQTISFNTCNINIWWIEISLLHPHKGTVLIKEMEIENFIKIDADNIQRSIFYPFDYACQCSIIQIGKNKLLQIPNQSCTLYLSSNFFQQAHLVGLQFFLRLFFSIFLLLLLFILYKKSKVFDGVFLVIGLFIVTLPLKIDYNTWAMVIMSLTIILIFIRKKTRHFTWQPIFYVLCALYLINVIGLLYTSNLHLGARRLDRIIPLVIFPIIFSMVQFTKRDVILILRFFVWTVIVFCFFSFLSYATIVPELTWDMFFTNSKLYAPLLLMWPALGHSSYVSTIIIMAIPIAIYLRFQGRKEISIIELCLGVLLPIIFTILTGARIGLVIIPFLLFFAYCFYFRLKPILKWGLVGLGMIILCLFIYKFPQADDRFQDPIREDLRTIAIEAIKEKPILGWGTGYVTPLIRSEETKELLGIETPYPFNQFHNQYLENMVQFGIPGILILLLLFVWMLYLSIRHKDYLLLSLMTIYVLFFWTESALFTSKGIVPFTFWLCFLVATQRLRLGHNEKLNEQVNKQLPV